MLKIEMNLFVLGEPEYYGGHHSGSFPSTAQACAKA